ncbi:MAG: hypothetical protein R3B09_30015 [Nannocystaceae bacterium]
MTEPKPRPPGSGGRLALRLGLAYFAVATASLVWPLYPALGNAIEPRVLGLPWSLVYVLVVIVANTAALMILYGGRWIDAGEVDDPVEPAAGEAARVDEVGR